MSRLIQIRTKASEYDGEFRWQAAGMSYLFVNEAHEYAVIDGGRETGDIDELYRLMREDCGKDAVRVRYWFGRQQNKHFCMFKEIQKCR